jgi:predicted amidophosphoribosyltransferase
VAPARCPGCDRAPGPRLCLACTAGLPAITFPCTRCGSPRQAAAAICGSCLDDGIPGVASLTVRWAYRDRLAALVGDCKASEDLAAGLALAALLPGPLPAVDVVTPIPPSPGRRGGPHLGTLLARQVARRSDLPLRRLLRLGALAADQHRLGAGDRQRNVKGLFTCPRPSPPQVLLVDDILTSGATIQAAARALRAAGATSIHVLCLARTPRADDDAPLETDGRRLSTSTPQP